MKILEKLGVVIPVHNLADRLQNLETLLSLSPDFEIVIVCDSCSDSTELSINDLIKRYGILNAKVYSVKFGNPGSSRNFGKKNLSQGVEWVAFWDPDDLPDPQVVISSIAFAESANKTIICEFETVNELNGALKEISHTSFPYTSLGVYPGIWRFIFRREVVDSIDFDSYRMGEDVLFLLKLDIPRHNPLFIRHASYKYFYGSDKHLTSERQNFKDLIAVWNKIAGIYQNLNFKKNDFLRVSLVRIFISGWSNASKLEKARMLKKLVTLTPYLFLDSVGLIKCARRLLNLSKQKSFWGF